MTLKKMCEHDFEGKPYYRPFTCNGAIGEAKTFLVGTNPATSIYPSQMNIDDYVDLLLDYDRFMDFYKKTRIEANKTKISRTRVGMNAFMDWIRLHTNSSIIETDIIPFPTAKLKELKKEPEYIINRGKEIFYELLVKLQPEVIILHGKKTINHFNKISYQYNLSISNYMDLDRTIKELESQVPLFIIEYPSGKKGVGVACRHFMYYGATGNSYRLFREKLSQIMKDVN